MYSTKQHRSRAKKNFLVSTRPNGDRKYRKALVREETAKPRGPKNIHRYVREDDLSEYNQPSYQLLEEEEYPAGLRRQFLFDPEHARTAVSLFSR